eukprot:CAMPEP_0196764016 /NCGR_PEP_ID=MMETSP1095-20130614/5229_1 /TAXON_ID=96789 ORGANISM="Chromulina nebulosa, Strain UTEXLB2642" /NCGR_SAMPLE_ID=MMETSP1095 /ASSEMBLY_ACC=CAM_ASM_000446 /LENGTH=575 /DNA_ID=CAMNT_0042118515 /DNA_START=824 /DNA_END=2548 /DNA_ORIENTATION=-
MDHLVISISDNYVTIWRNCLSPGYEFAAFVYSSTNLLNDCLKEVSFASSSSALASAVNLRICDGAILCNDGDEDSFTLVLLSTCSTDTVANTTTSSLWVHVISLAVNELKSFEFRRISTVLVDSFISDCLSPQCHYIRSDSCDYRLFISWSHKHETISSINLTDNGLKNLMTYQLSESISLFSAHIDVLSMSPVEVDVSKDPALFTEDTEIEVDDILTVQIVNGLNGIVVIKRDGSVSISCPVAQGQSFGSKHNTSAGRNPRDVLLAIAIDKMSISQMPRTVLTAMSKMSSEEIEQLVKDVETIISSDLSLYGSTATDQVVATKLANLRRLIDALVALGLSLKSSIYLSLCAVYQKTLLLHSLLTVADDMRDKINNLLGNITGLRLEDRAIASAYHLWIKSTAETVKLNRQVDRQLIDSMIVEVFSENYNNAISVIPHIIDLLEYSIDKSINQSNSLTFLSNNDKHKVSLYEVFGVSVLFTSALDAISGEYGGHCFESSVLTNDKVRSLLTKLLSYLCDSSLSELPEIHSTNLMTVNQRNFKSTIRSLCVYALTSYELESLASGSKYGDTMPNDW